jgi:hypothetical protein
MKNAMIQFDFRGMTTKQYDQIWQDLRATGHSNPKGLLHHYGSTSPKGIHVCDIWESEDRFREFGKVLMPILEKNKVPKTEPVIAPLHFEYNSKLVAM